jgi:hypothetical protein
MGKGPTLYVISLFNTIFSDINREILFLAGRE